MHCSGADDDAADNNDDDPLVIVLARGNCEALCVKCDRMGLTVELMMMLLMMI